MLSQPKLVHQNCRYNFSIAAWLKSFLLAKRMAAENPKQVAQVVKSWVSDDGG